MTHLLVPLTALAMLAGGCRQVEVSTPSVQEEESAADIQADFEADLQSEMGEYDALEEALLKEEARLEAELE